MDLHTRLTNSITAMFNQRHACDVAPSWLVTMCAQRSAPELVAMMNNWRHNHPELYARHGIFVF